MVHQHCGNSAECRRQAGAFIGGGCNPWTRQLSLQSLIRECRNQGPSYYAVRQDFGQCPRRSQSICCTCGYVPPAVSFQFTYQQYIIRSIQLTKKNPPPRLVLFLAALDLFAHHIHLFRPLLIDIYEWMYQRIAGYCEHTHDKMSKCGYNALDVFLQEVILGTWTGSMIRNAIFEMKSKGITPASMILHV